MTIMFRCGVNHLIAAGIAFPMNKQLNKQLVTIAMLSNITMIIDDWSANQMWRVRKSLV